MIIKVNTYDQGYADAWSEMQDMVNRHIKPNMTVDDIIRFMNAIITETNYHELKAHEVALHQGGF